MNSRACEAAGLRVAERGRQPAGDQRIELGDLSGGEVLPVPADLPPPDLVGGFVVGIDQPDAAASKVPIPLQLLHVLERRPCGRVGKLGFRWVYWNMLMPGRPLPIPSLMSLSGKRTDLIAAK